MFTGIQNQREKYLAGIAAAVIVAAAVYSTVLTPQLRRRKLNLQRFGELQLKLARMKGDLLVKDRIDSIYSEIEPLISSSNTDQHEISLLTREMSELYSDLDVKIRSVKILPVTQEQFYRRLGIKIEMTGPIRNILQFIVLVESYQDPLRIDRLELTAQQIVDSVKATFLITKVIAEPRA